MLLRTAALLSAWLLMAPCVPPDSWMPFCNQRVVSASGRRYVVIRQAKQGVTFELCERAAGAPAMLPAQASPIAVKQDDVARDPNDRLVVAGTFGQEPLAVLVPDTLPGFLLFEKYGNVGGGKSVAWIDGAGNETVGLKLTEIFGAVPKAATYTVSSIWWNEGYWIDEAQRSIVVVAAGDELREIAIADGAVTTPDGARLAAWCTAGTVAARSLALEVASRRDRAGRKDAVPLAMRIFHDEHEPLALRLRAAVLLAAAETPVACEALFAAARGQDQPEPVRRYAVRHLPAVLGEQAIVVLRELMRGKAGPLWGDCYQAFVAIGEPAVPTLVAMLGERDETSDYRGGAAHALREIRSKDAFEALLLASADPSEYVANAAINAAIATGGDRLGERLIALLDEGSTQDGRIALWLKEHPTRAALPAIDKALARATDGTDREWLAEARAACAQ